MLKVEKQVRMNHIFNIAPAFHDKKKLWLAIVNIMKFEIDSGS